MTDSPIGITFGARMSAYLTSAEDYNKYRKKLNKTLLRSRHDLKIVTRDTKNYREKESFSKINEESYNEDKRFGRLILLTAERDLLYALEIKNLMEISGERVSSYKNLMISKIKKSLSNCQKLLQVIQSEADEIIKLEFYIYSALVQGLYSINKKQWSKAINSFSVARCALDYQLNQLVKKENNSEDDEFNKTVINEILDNLIDPSLNLAISQSDVPQSTSDLKSISRKHCHDDLIPFLKPAVSIIKKLDESFVSDVSSEIQLINSIKWRDYEATLYNDELAYKIMKLNETDWERFEDANQYDAILTGWNELLEIHTVDLEKNQDEDDLDKVQDRAVLLTYINYNLLFTRLKRDLLIIDQLDSNNKVSMNKKLEINKDIHRLYATIVETSNQLKDLPGVYNDEDLYFSLDNLSKYYESQKNMVLAQSFALSNKFSEALKIFTHIQKSLKESASESFYKIDQFPYRITDNQDFEKFIQDLNNQTLKIHILTQFNHELSQGDIRQSNYVLENLNKYLISKNSSITNVDHLGEIKPLLIKPVLFDIGFNYINYSSSANSIAASAQPSSSAAANDDDNKKRSGFFGIFGRS